MNYLWLILLAVYIISPIDGHPLFFDDLIAAAAMLYILYKISKQNRHRQQRYDYYGGSQTSGRSQQNKNTETPGPITLSDAYKLLGVSEDSSPEEISRAYRDKISRSHPDKVSHLSEELQEKAEELTLRINEAFDLVKRHKKM